MNDTKRMMVKAIGGLAILVGVGLAVAVGCKKKGEVGYPQPQPDAGSTWTDAGTVRDAGATDAAATADAQTPPEPTFDEMTKAQLSAQIEQRAKTEAPYMKPVGEVFGGVAKDGGQVDSPVFQIELGKCYTVIAQGGMGIVELDVQLKGAQMIPGMQPTLAVDNTTGAAAAIAPCWKNGFPVGFPATVSLIARSGSGAVAARVYMK